MNSSRLSAHPESHRLAALGFAMAIGFMALAGRLWQVQVARGEQYRKSLERQSIRRIRTPALRGRIYDREGRLLADNRPSYDLVLYLEELRRPGPWNRTLETIQETIAEVERRIGRPCETDAASVRRHVQRRLPLPLTILRNLSDLELARWAEQVAALPGVELEVRPVRFYPSGPCAAHVIGYVGRADPPPDEEEPYHFALPDTAGRSGIERQYDEWLRGEPGGVLVRVDASGFRRATLGQKPSKAGWDLRLSLDLRIQQMALEAFHGKAGAAVVLDPRNGDVLALVSSPSFDPNALVPALPALLWEHLRSDGEQPLFNRATQGSYPPGSTFKPLVALAALRSGWTPVRYDCEGRLWVGNRPFHCWAPNGHGTLDLVSAIKLSCNVFFYRLALQTGPDQMIQEALNAGLGASTGIDLDGEAAGFVPSPAWKRKMLREAWTGGDTCLMGIGQGALLATPLQMAVVAAALANGGRRVTPRLLLGLRRSEMNDFEELVPDAGRDLGWSAAWLGPIREGMRQAVMSDDGTARLARIPGVEVAAKTGTAQYQKGGELRKRGWIIGFAPFDSPRAAFAVVVEEAVSGGVTAAPIARAILEAIWSVGGGAQE